MLDTPGKKTTGRPTALTPELHELVVAAVAKGHPLCIAASAAGVAEKTVCEWIRRGKGEDTDREATEPYISFATAIEKARGNACAESVDIIRSAALSGQWQAAAWYLERVKNRVFGLRVKEAVNDAKREMLDLLADKLPAEQYNHVLEILRGGGE